MAAPIEISDDVFDDEIGAHQGLAVVDFWATWCGPCHMIAPVIEQLADEYDGKIKFVKVDTEENFETPSTYGVLSLPTLLVFKEGQQIERINGAHPKGDLMRYLDKALA